MVKGEIVREERGRREGGEREEAERRRERTWLGMRGGSRGSS